MYVDSGVFQIVTRKLDMRAIGAGNSHSGYGGPAIVERRVSVEIDAGRPDGGRTIEHHIAIHEVNVQAVEERFTEGSGGRLIIIRYLDGGIGCGEPDGRSVGHAIRSPKDQLSVQKANFPEITAIDIHLGKMVAVGLVDKRTMERPGKIARDHQGVT